MAQTSIALELTNCRHRRVPSFRLVPILLFALNVALLTPSLAAQSDRELQAYRAVAEQSQNGDVLALENYVSAAPQGYLRTNGTELLIWEYRKMGDSGRAQKWAAELLKVQEDNPLALATLADNQNRPLTETSPGEKGADQSLSMAKRALRGLDQMKPIEGMPENTFYQMRSNLERSLNGNIGYAYYQRNDYLTAREYLRRSASTTPDNAQLVYALAIADLYGKPPDKAEGYQMLARAVNLSQKTPAGEELSKFARDNFQQAGGKSQDWDAYLANTRPPAQRSQTVEASASTPTSPATTGGASGVAATASNNQAPTVSAPRTPAAAQPENKPAAETPTIEVAKVSPTPDVAPPPSIAPKPPRKIAPAGAALSIGILIETSAASKENRRAVVNSLANFVRQLRQQDEAFVVSFSKDVVFEQDLTDNAQDLEKAMDSIKPLSGTALFDAVAFASGHLKRISRNPRRVLIVISDGTNQTNRISPLELSGELNVSGVEVYCIGLGADTSEDQARLRALADRTGGRALLTSDVSQFRNATQQVAQALGLQ
jgi:tetratricopeptide (TPR) repeat protein